MLLTGGTLISKCCKAIIYDEGGYHCMKCFLPCEEGGTVADLYEPENRRRELEHSLATGFIKLQKERDPAARQAQWVGLQRLAREIERLQNGETNATV